MIDTDAGDGFDSCVSRAADALASGAPAEDSAATDLNGDDSDDTAADSGAVYTFTRSSTTWAQTQYVKASNTDPGDSFGFSCSYDAATLAVGAPNEDSDPAIGPDDNSAPQSGAVYTY